VHSGGTDLRSFVIAVAALLLAACGQLSRVPPLRVGPVESNAETFERLQTFVQARGYVPTHTNATRGTLRFRSSFSRPGLQYTFTIQCYREGWVALIPQGPRVRRDRDSWLMPGPLRREYVDLGVALASAMQPSSERAE
jgi:hypothetical protein